MRNLKKLAINKPITAPTYGTEYKVKVVRHWHNGFAENCYKLEDGTTLYFDLGGKTLRVHEPVEKAAQ